MDLGLHGKKALITGASRGLGAATALALAGEGARIAINSRDAGRLRKTADEIASQAGGKVLAFPGDLSQPIFPASLVEQAAGGLGGLDILVVNYGGPPPGRFEEFDDAAWQDAFNLMLMGAVRLVRAALPHLRKSTAPAVLTVTSYAVKQPIPNPCFPTPSAPPWPA